MCVIELTVFLRAFAKYRKATISFVVSVRPPAWNNSAFTGRVSMKFYIWACLENLSRKFEFNENITRKTGILHEDRYTFVLIHRLFIFRVRIFRTKFVEKIKTWVVFSNFFKNSFVYYITWKNAVEPERPQITIWPMRISRWVRKAADTLRQWRTEWGLGCSTPPPPRNSEGPPKSCQTQPDCENC